MCIFWQDSNAHFHLFFCQERWGYTCTNYGNGDQQPSTCATEVCGVVAGSEQCDDMDSAATDGCDVCMKEAGHACTNTLCGQSKCVWLTCNEVCSDGFTLGGKWALSISVTTASHPP